MKVHLRFLIFLVSLAGNVTFIAYRANFTTLLTTEQPKLPFTDLNGLAKSNFRYSHHT